MTTTQDSATDSDLLRAYAADGSDAAFHGLVRRHLGLVHHAALRLLDGDAAAAEDVAQTVFTDLARKAGDLAEHGSLAGWLHTSTRFAAAKVKRSEERRRLREHATMHHPSSDDSAPLWDELRPVLDDALHELPGTDREAVLLRFFEKLSLSEVGSRLGVGEDAARKRVDRALDRLRDLLAARGVTSATSAAALALLLETRLSAQTTLALQETVARTALSTAGKTAAVTAAGGGWLAWFLGWPAKVTLVAGLAAIVLSVAAVSRRTDADSTAPASVLAAALAAPEETVATEEVVAAAPVVAPVIDEAASGQPKLLLKLVDAATDRPVAGGEIEFRGLQGEQFIGKTYHSDSNGYCPVYYPAGITDLELTTRIDGLADTRLKWTPKNGEFIPMDYTLRLVKGLPIGGVVVDEAGKPVAGAKIDFGHEDDPQNYKGPESNGFGGIGAISDSEGRWRIWRIASKTLPLIWGSAAHPHFGPSESLNLVRSPDQLESLKGFSHRFILKSGITVSGVVVDDGGVPLAGADVLVGMAGDSSRRTGKTDADGTFSIKGNSPGISLITASTASCSPTTMKLELVQGMPPVRLTVAPGKTLLLKITDRNGHPIPGATCWYDCINQFPAETRGQANFESQSDANGQVVWSNAPAGELNFHIRAAGYLGQSGWRVEADDTEHLVGLDPALRLVGEVRDATTGQLVPSFRLSLGAAQQSFRRGQTNNYFPAYERFHMDMVGGRFDRLLEETTLGGSNPPPCVVKVTTEGYRSYLSRPIAWNEGEVRLDVVLRPQLIREIEIQNPDGSPAGDAEVALVHPESWFQLRPGGFDRYGNIETSLRADGAGKIKLSIDEDVQLLVAANSSGYGEFSLSEIQRSGILRLKEWGRVEGRLVGSALATSRNLEFRGVPPDSFVTLQRSGFRPMVPAPIQASFTGFMVKADQDGRFVIPMAPPGKWSVVPAVVFTERGQEIPNPGNPKTVDIPPGDTVHVVLGGDGTRITARLDPNSFNLGTTIAGYVTTAGSVPPLELWGKSEETLAWLKQPGFRNMEVRRYPFREEDGLLIAEDVAPGSYTLQIFAAPENPVGMKQLNFTVPDPAPPEGIDLGEIQLEPLGK